MVGSRVLWGTAGVVSLLAHAGAAAILSLSPTAKQEEALVAGGVVAEIAMLGNSEFEAVESGMPDDAIRPEEILPEEFEPIQQEVAEIVPEAIEPEPMDVVEPLDIEPIVSEPVEALEIQGAEVEIAAIPIPEIKPEIEPEMKAEAIQPVPEKKKEPVKKVEKKVQKKQPVARKAGEQGKSRQNATKGQVDGSADVKTASLGGQTRGNSLAAGNAAVSNYPGTVRNKINRSKRRVSGGGRGGVVVSFVVSSGGQASGIRVAKSSGNSRLDTAAVDAVRRASPFPQIPAQAGRSSWSFSVPIVFN